MYEIVVGAKARRQLRQIARKDRKAFTAVELAISSLAAWPVAKQVRSLTAHKSHYRLRAGRYRVLFDVDTEIKIVHVREVRRRDDHTY
jgi:mRNA-degrading endonuclease RelE of RelBE toxin-antitoxin system